MVLWWFKEWASASLNVTRDGTRASGLEFVIVSTPVSDGCHEAQETWERWPSDRPEWSE
jgi:hypothetical protein